MIDRAKKVLKSVFGYDGFISLQEDVIGNVLRGRDTLVIMPTGGGKSLCYQVPALIFPGLTVVVSPLISLMKDQVEQLREAGAPAALLNSALSDHAYRQNVRWVRRGEAKLLYLAPETLLKRTILAMLSSIQVSCLAIDEAHCISEWGHDFRPEYRQLASFRSNFPGAVCVALTATATPRVRKDIQTSLGLDKSGEFVASFNRENLLLSVVEKKNPLDKTIRFLQKYRHEPGIIYCLSRAQVDDLCVALEVEGFSVKPYHAGLADETRSLHQTLFIRDDVQIIVATIAFGMGINKSNIRFVIHYDLPKSIESYYQEIGRAGRDGLPSECLMLFSYGDVQKVKFFINKKEGEEKRKDNIRLNALLRFTEAQRCRRIPLLNYFGEEREQKKCDMCDNCLSGEKERTDVTIAAQKFLSCVKRTGEMFGAVHIIDVLRGSKAKKVLKFRHDKLSTYGIGMEYSKRQWLRLSRQFLHKGLLIQDSDHGGVRLGAGAWDVFKGKTPVLAILEEMMEKEKPRTSKPDEEPAPEHDHELFDILRLKRKSMADKARVPPYVIFSDKTLVEMSARFPRTRDDMLAVHGVGEVKLRKYGAIFLEIITNYCEERQIPGGPPAISEPSVAAAPVFEPSVGPPPISEPLPAFPPDSEPLPPFPPEPEPFAAFPPDYESFAAFPPEPEPLPVSASVSEPLTTSPPGSEPSVAAPRSDKKTYTRQIVCLANSRKHSGCCVVGKELSDGRIGGWIRPVSDRSTGELSPDESRVLDGSPPRLLNIITISLKEYRPHFHQTENHLIADGQWLRSGNLPAAKLPGLRDDVDRLWINGYHGPNGANDRIPVNLTNERLSSSLLFIRPDRLWITVVEEEGPLEKVRARFDYKNETYSLTVADPVVKKRYIKKGSGEYPVEKQDVHLTVSLGEPHDGFCHKRVEAII